MRKLVTFLLCSLLSVSAFAHGPTRQKVVETIKINAPADKVWEVVGDFSSLHKWHPAIESTEMQGDKIRVLTLAPDRKITEELKKLDKERKILKYKIKDMSVVETFDFAGSKVERKVLPVNTYSSLIKVKEDGDGSEVMWQGKFYRAYLLNPPTPEGMSDKDAIATVSSIYQEGLDNLKRMIEDGSIANAKPATVTSAPAPKAPETKTAETPKTEKPKEVVAAPAKVEEKKEEPAKATEAPVAAKPVKKASGDFDPNDAYSAHVQCESGKNCKVDKFLLKGFRAFSQCQVCHGIDGNGSTIAPSLLVKLKKEITYDLFIDRVTNGFQGQMGVMPPWKDNPNIMKHIDQLYAYLKARSDGVIPAGRLKKFKKKK